LIQRKQTTKSDENTVFWFNLAGGFVCGGAVLCASDWIASFYGIPVLASIAKINAIQIVLGSSISLHGTLFVKKLDFKRPALISICSMVVSGLVGVILAVAGYGVWALVGQGVTQSLVSLILTWFLSPWRPCIEFSTESFRQLFKFGGFFFAARLLDVVYQRGYGLLLGKWYGTGDLGLYNRADSTQKIPSQGITSVISRISFPMFSAANQDPVKLKALFEKALRWVSIINAPVMLGLAVAAKPLIEVLFGNQWTSAAPILQILALSGLLWPIHLLNLSVLQALGHSNLFFRLEIIKKIIGVSLLMVGMRYGVLGLAYGKLAGSVISLFINTHYTRVFLSCGTIQQLKGLCSSFAKAALMALAVSAIMSVTSFNPYMNLTILLASGVAIYGVIVFAVSPQELIELLNLVRGFFGRSKREANAL
jgi:O-antigen/teichoic acid export membrane protein